MKNMTKPECLFDTTGNDIQISISFFVEFHEARLTNLESIDLIPKLSYSFVSDDPIVVEIRGVCFDI